ncbi:peptidylprolyl isomerase [Reichenbachiella ulvae]|uniref:Peptidyl-prolyl cis-trans isomerase n=1 Tax=Reichenbachiella ulvae TaxID=2980104 RepID=A0ABT3CX57_9BACT|nr:peptidylprolyl isomerase [Reichenbachiella ulvae]MCV9388217.1 peptidylprolyl isomerase [Reichenbachiella ulvae]
MKKQISLAMAFLAVLVMVSCANDRKDYIVTIHTSFGDMKVLLYDETPLHKANFIELAESGDYDSTIFHRVIKDFMIQGGGIDMKTGENKSERIPAELDKGYLHVKGALAAARQGDRVNPKKASSWCQFYIVDGKKYTPEEIEAYENQLNMGKVIQRPENQEYLKAAQSFQKEGNQVAVDSIIAVVMEQIAAEFEPIQLTDKQKEAYTTKGGAPHLDFEYTVFGQVVEGLDVIDKIAAVKTGRADKPVEDYFLTMEVEKLPKRKITKLYGYEYPEKK